MVGNRLERRFLSPASVGGRADGGVPSAMLGVSLQRWVDSHPVRDEMLWKGGAEGQIAFVRQALLPVFASGLKFDNFEDYRNMLTVIGSHTSKSIKLPVFQLSRPDRNLQIVLRNNFMDWKMSVISEAPIDADFTGLFHTTPPVDPDYTGDSLHEVYFEGFPKDRIFGYYADSDRKKWSAEMQHDEEVYAAVFLTMRALGQVKPLEWGMSKEFKAKLEAAKASEAQNGHTQVGTPDTEQALQDVVDMTVR